MPDLSLYVHFPFCSRRCGYCDFNTNTAAEGLIPAYVEALKNEIGVVSQVVLPDEHKVHTIYLGGGTPTLASPGQIGEVLEAIRNDFDLTEDCEITIEANPGTVTPEVAVGLVGQGVNRISIGMQSSDRRDLVTLDREHIFERVAEAVEHCRRAGIGNLSLDLIYGIPNQTIDSWGKSLGDALSLAPEHLSLYALTIEEGTPLADRVDLGAVIAPDEDLAADMYELAMVLLGENGFLHYEISNWGQSGRQSGPATISRHNRQYWLNEPYLGLGTGAHGFFGGKRIQNEPGLMDYLKLLTGLVGKPTQGFPAADVIEAISRNREMQETMMMGLRLLEDGVSKVRFKKRFGVEMGDVFSSEIKKLADQGLVEWVGESGKEILRLTKRAYLVANRVFGEFV